MQDKAFGNLLCCTLVVKMVCILWLFYASNEATQITRYAGRKAENLIGPLLKLHDLVDLMYKVRGYCIAFILVVMIVYGCSLNIIGNVSLGPYNEYANQRARDYA